MTRYLLDTNIISEATKSVPSPRLEGWLKEQNDSDLFTSAVTIGEIWRGILQLPQGQRRRGLEDWFSGQQGPSQMFEGRVLPFDGPAALRWGRLMAEGAAAGRPRSAVDMMIAAIAETNLCVLVTANEKHFRPAVEALNPLRL